MKLYFEANDFIRLSLINGKTVEGRVISKNEEEKLVIIRPQIPKRNYSATLETVNAEADLSIHINTEYIVDWRKVTANEIRSAYRLLLPDSN